MTWSLYSDVWDYLLSAGVRGALAAAIVLAVVAIWRRPLQPAQEFKLWLLVLSAHLIPVTWTVPVRTELVPSATRALAVADGSLGLTGASGTWWLIWVVAAGLLMAASIVGFARAYQRARRSAVAPPAWRHIASEVAAAYRISTPSVRVRAAVHPHTVGWLRPIVVLPEDLGEADARMVLWHEIAHVARRDGLTAWIIVAARAAFFFSPVVWFVTARMHVLREMATDELAVHGSGLPSRAFAELLLNHARRTAAPSIVPWPVTSLWVPSALAARIGHLMRVVPADGSRVVAICLATVVSIVAWVTPSTRFVPVEAECDYSSEVARDLLMSHPEADADNDGVLSRQEACDYQAHIRRRGAGVVAGGAGADTAAFPGQGLCCDCRAGESMTDGPASSTPAGGWPNDSDRARGLVTWPATERNCWDGEVRNARSDASAS